MKKVSIIVPVYNVEKDIGKCVDSIISQTYKDWDLWLIDDGSKDESPSICDAFAQYDERIQVVHKENGGVSSARNRGLEEATGDYILFVDSDDYLESCALEKLVDATDKGKADVVLCGFYYRMFEDNSYVENVPDNYFAGNNSELIEQCFVNMFQRDLFNPPWNKLIKRSVIEQRGIKFNEKISILEDLAFSIQVLGACKKIVVLNDAVYNYVFKSQNNLVHKFHANFFEALKYMDSCLSEYISDNQANILIDAQQEFFIKKIYAYLRKVYTDSGYDNKRKYQEISKICRDEDVQRYVSQYNVKEFKKCVAKYCIKHKLCILLHWLYLLT
ncbi:MAG: glycosyltransferase family 2 protein [Lachnospiraceae bacterium]|nr:glycosyltransferase family 2 protein [Lachnospiraceae bacterium]